VVEGEDDYQNNNHPDERTKDCFHEVLHLDNCIILGFCQSIFGSLDRRLPISVIYWSMKLNPTSNHIILKPLDAEKTTASGIIIPDTVSKDKPEQAEVLAVGPGKVLEGGSRQPVEIKVGQKVLFKKYSPDEFEIDNQKYLVISEEDVIAIIE